MKKRLFFFLAVMLMALTAAATVSCPYTEDFESMTANSVPTGWDNSGSTTSKASGSYSYYVWGVYSYSGNNSIRMYNFMVNAGSALINSPSITLPSSGAIEFDFDYSNLANCGDMTVSISTDNGSTFTQLGTYSNASGTNNYTNPGTFTSVSLDISSYAGQTVILQFYATANYSSGAIFVDNIYVGAAATCFPVTDLTVSDITATDAKASWTASGHGETQYQYSLVTTGSAADWTNAVIVSGTNVQLSGLTANTGYDLYVRSYCGTDDQSKVVKTSFKTSCAAQTPEDLGLIDFDGYTGAGTSYNTALTDNCWQKVGNQSSTSTSYYPYVYKSSAYAHSGENSLKIYGYQSSYSSYDGAYAVLPEIDFSQNPIQSYYLNFWFRKSSANSSYSNYNDTLYVGVVEDPADLSTLEIVGTAVNTTTTYANAKVSFADYGGRGTYVVLLGKVNQNASASSKYVSFYVDDIEFKVPLACAMPTNLKDSDVTANSAVVAWSGSASAYNVYVAAQSVRPDTVTTSWLQTVNATDTFTTISGLTPNTKYYVYVKADCGGSGESEFSEGLSLRTACAIITPDQLGVVGFETSEGFESGAGNLANCWTGGNVQAPTNSAYIPYVYNSNFYSYAGSNCLKLQAYKYSTYQYDSAYAVLPELDFSQKPIQDYYLQFQFRKTSTSSSYTHYNDTLYVGVVEDPQDLSTLEIVGKAINTTDSYAKAKIPFANYQGRGNYIVLLAATDVNSTMSTKYGSFYVDNVEIKEALSCATPTGVKAESVGSDNATLKWNGGTADYRVYLSSAAVLPDTVTNWLQTADANDSVKTLKNLDPNTIYYAYVRKVCGVGDSSEYSDGISFQTECVAIALPWTEGFESATSNKMPDCWKKLGTASYPYVYNSSYSAMTGSQCLYFYGGSSYYGDEVAVLPALGFDLNTARLKFYYKQSYTSSSYPAPEIGIMSDPADASTFVPIKTLDKTSSYTQAIIDITADSAVQGRYNYLAIRVPATGSSCTYYVDDMELVAQPTCLAPQNLTLGDITTTSAVLNWTSAAALGDSVLIVSGTDTIFNNLVTGNTLKMENLTVATNYNWYVTVKGICSSDDHSEETYANLKFQTECETIVSYPWKETFDALTSGIPACWDNSEGTTTTNTYKWNASTGGVDGTECLKFNSYNNSNGNTNILATPTFNLTSDLVLSFQAKNAAGGTPFKVQIAVDGGDRTDLLTIGTPSDWTDFTADLSAYTGKTVVFYFCSTSNCGYGDAYHYLDNVKIAPAATCFKPANIHVIDSLATTSSVTLAWSAPTQGASQYRVAVVNGTDSLVKNVLTADTFYVVSGLNSSTSYALAVTVASHCSDADESDEVKANLTAATLCETIINFPWSDGFESYASGTTAANMACYQNEKVGNASDWAVTTSMAHSGENYIQAKYSGYADGRTESILDLPDMLFENGKKYAVQYYLKGYSSNTADSLYVMVNQNILRSLHVYSIGTDWVEYNDTLVGTGVVSNIRFDFVNENGWYAYLDDVTISLVEDTPTWLGNDAAAEQKAVKFIKEGKLYIRKDGVLYDAVGRKVE